MGWISNAKAREIEENVSRKLAEQNKPKPAPAKLPWTSPQAHQPKTKGKR